ncbi:glycosyltransferase family 4 protein [Bacteroides congonensis]
MKIVYCIAGTYNSGGMERVLANKANYLARKGYEIVIITTDQRNRCSFFAFDARISFYDLEVNYEENNGGTFLDKLVHYPFKQIKHKRRLTKLLMQLKADIVISMFCNEASFLWKIKDGSRKILEVHFCRYKRLQLERKGVWKLADSFRNRMDIRTVRKYDHFVVLTKEDERYWEDVPRVTVIPNMLSFSFTEPASLSNKKVIAVGRYDYQKGFDYLIDAWAIVNKHQPEWVLEIIGGGEWKSRLQKQIDESGLQDCICLKAPTSDIEEEYRQASMLVMSSRYEGFGMVLVEAQSAGLPVISFTCKCGPRDIITDGMDGFLVAEKDVAGLANTMLCLMQDENMRRSMGMAAMKNSRRFSETAVMGQWEELFAHCRKNI